jgi:hypothetical protein
MAEKMSEHFHFEKLMNPDLMPTAAFEKDVSIGIRPFSAVKCDFGIIQERAAPAK